jgi:hypothetical protein
MNLDDLQKVWIERDQRLEKSIQLNTRLLREARADRYGTSVRRQSLVDFLIQLPFALLTIAVLGRFIAAHIDELKFAFPAIALDAWCIAMLAALIQQFVAMRHLDLGQPVITLQRRLALIKINRLRLLKWSFLTGLVLWTAPLMIVVAKGFFNVDLYAASGFLIINVVVTVIMAALLIWLLKRYAGRFQHSFFGKEILDSLAGRDLAKATAFLDQLSNFEKEETQS